jgi:hypothetical protein
MAQSITITIQNDAKAVLLLNAFAKDMGYEETVENPAFDNNEPVDPETNPTTIPNPQSKKVFLKKMTIKWWIERARSGKYAEEYQAVLNEFNDVNIVID